MNSKYPFFLFDLMLIRFNSKVNMLLLFGTQTRLQKLLDSLKAHLFINNQDERIFLETVKDAITQDFITETQRLESTDTEAKEDIPNIR